MREAIPKSSLGTSLLLGDLQWSYLRPVGIERIMSTVSAQFPEHPSGCFQGEKSYPGAQRCYTAWPQSALWPAPESEILSSQLFIHSLTCLHPTPHTSDLALS